MSNVKTSQHHKVAPDSDQAEVSWPEAILPRIYEKKPAVEPSTLQVQTTQMPPKLASDKLVPIVAEIPADDALGLSFHMIAPRVAVAADNRTYPTSPLTAPTKPVPVEPSPPLTPSPVTPSPISPPEPSTPSKPWRRPTTPLTPERLPEPPPPGVKPCGEKRGLKDQALTFLKKVIGAKSN